MPVDRSYIAQFAYDPAQTDLYQALTQLANFSDTLEQKAGIRVSATGSTAPAPAASQWAIAAAAGHYLIQITPPAAATAPVQHQLRSALDQNFDANSSVFTYTLGLGENTLDLVDPNETRYWQMRSRYQGSGWNNWLSYATAAGVVALNAGALRTS